MQTLDKPWLRYHSSINKRAIAQARIFYDFLLKGKVLHRPWLNESNLLPSSVQLCSPFLCLARCCSTQGEPQTKETFDCPPKIFDCRQTTQSSIEQHRKKYNKWSNECNISPSSNVVRCSVMCRVCLTRA